MSDEDDDRPPLSYRDPREDRRPLDLQSLIFYGCVGAAPVVLAGLTQLAIHVPRVTSRPVSHVPPSLGFAIVAVPALVGAWATFRRSGHRRARLLGWLLGTGVTCLIEGACFAGQG